jgi:Ca2+-transporting ATPase
MFNYAVSGSLIGQAAVVYVPFLQSIFQTEALGLLDWVQLLFMASFVLWADEFRKYLKRRGRGFGGGYSTNV